MRGFYNVHAQGLSDFRGSELPRLGAILDHRCELYRAKKDSSVPGGVDLAAYICCFHGFVTLFSLFASSLNPPWNLEPIDTNLVM